MLQQDALTSILQTLRIQNPQFGRIELRAPWGGPVNTDADLLLHHVLAGTAWLHDEGAVTPVVAGDVLLLSRHPHALSHSAEYPKEVLFWDGSPEPVGTLAVRRSLGGVGDETILLCASMSVEGAGKSMLLSALPHTIHLSEASTIPGFAQVLDCIRDEVSAERPGGALILTRFAELLVLEVLRAARSFMSGWMAALTDPGLSRALASLYHRPAHPWTVAELAGVAGMSRSGFAQAFRQQVGESPIRHLTRWRMAMASELLRDGEPIINVALAVGYQNEAAFGTAFRRETGLSPGRFQRGGDRRTV